MAHSDMFYACLVAGLHEGIYQRQHVEFVRTLAHYAMAPPLKNITSIKQRKFELTIFSTSSKYCPSPLCLNSRSSPRILMLLRFQLSSVAPVLLEITTKESPDNIIFLYFGILFCIGNDQNALYNNFPSGTAVGFILMFHLVGIFSEFV